MADYKTTDAELTAVANAIRAKGETALPLEYPAGFISAIDAITTGVPVVEEKDVNFVDYDGTVLYSYTAAEIAEMTSESDLPENPSHEGLTAQGWNWTLAQIKTQLTAAPGGPVWVGQMYVTQSGATEIDIALESSDFLSPYMYIYVNGTTTIDWGDNTNPDTLTGSSLSNNVQKIQHIYASIGNYTIKVKATSGQYKFYGDSKYFILGSDETQTIGSRSFPYVKSIKSIRIGSDCNTLASYLFQNSEIEYITIPTNITTIGTTVFSNLRNIKFIILPNSITSIPTETFQYSYYLVGVSIPPSVTTIGTYAFQYCYCIEKITIPYSVTSCDGRIFFTCTKLKQVVIPNNVTSIGQYAFSTCYSLKEIIMPNSITTILSYAFNGCSKLKSIDLSTNITTINASTFGGCYCLSTLVIPNGVTSIKNNAFASCYNLKELHLKSETPPTLENNTNTFSGLPSGFIIYVPYSEDHSILEAYQTAQYWSAFASNMQEEPAAA